jgi:hypothetical protein
MLKVGLLGRVAMHAMVGDRLHVHSRVVGASDQTSEIIEIRGRAVHLHTWCAATTGMRLWCSPERMRPWSTRRTANPAEGDARAPFCSPAGVWAQASIGGTPNHRWSVTAARLPLNRRSRTCHPGKQASPPTPPPLDAVPRTGLPRHRVGIWRNSSRAMGANAHRQPTRPDPDRPVRHE